MRTDESLRTPLLLLALVALLGGGFLLTPRKRPGPEAAGVTRAVVERSAALPNEAHGALPAPRSDGPRVARAQRREALAQAAPPGDDAAGAAPLSGRVLELGTGSPLQGCDVAILAALSEGPPELRELVRTGPDGRFRTRAALPAGTYWLYVLPDHCRARGERSVRQMFEQPSPHTTLGLDHHHEPDRPESEARIVVSRGPTYRFALSMPPGVDPCDCRVSLHHDLQERSRAQPPWAYLRALEPHWARFAERVPPELARLPPPWRLTIATWNGRFVGSAAVHSVEGECEDTVAIQLTERGGLRGVVRAHDGEPARWASLLFEPLRAPRFVDYDARVQADEDGRFELLRLPPGPARLVVEAEGFAAHVEELVVRAGEPRPHDVTLARVVLGEVSGWLNAGGQPIDPVPRVLLRLLDAPHGNERVARVYPLVAGGARFELTDVPPGEYELVIEALGPWRWSPRTLRVQAPAAGIELVRADEPLAMLLLDARAAEDGTPLARFDLWLETDEGLLHEVGGAGGAIVDRVPPDPELAFALTAPGRALVRGRLGELEANGRFRTGAFELARGFSTLVRAVDDASGAGLRDARVLLDGEEVARTDARGEALASAPEHPRTLTVAVAGRVLADDDLSAGRRTLDDPGDALTFRLRPER